MTKPPDEWMTRCAGRLSRLVVDPIAPDEAALAEAVRAIAAGDVIAFPTDTLYGLAADPFDADAVARVFAIKGRAPAQALPLVAADLAQVEKALGRLSPTARRLADRFWPGPLTLVVPAPSRLAPAVTGGTGTVGVRVPAHAVARALCRAAARPLVATSANRSAEPPTADPAVVARELGDRLALLVDAGPAPGGAPSTIVDVTRDPVRLVRAGAIDWEDVQRCLERG